MEPIYSRVWLKAVIGSSLFSGISSLAGIIGRISPLLTESSPPDGWNALEAVTARLEQVSNKVDDDWSQSALARVQSEDDIDTYSLK